jgi:hypothetical protein
VFTGLIWLGVETIKHGDAIDKSLPHWLTVVLTVRALLLVVS